MGAGITGLAAAHRVVELATTRRLPIDVVLFEARDRLGGTIHTTRRDGFLIEGGPDSFITQKPWGLSLVKRLGLEGRLIQTNPACRRTFVVRDGRMHAVPEGFLLLAPTRIWPFVTSRLFSWPAKLRMALDLVIPARDHGSEGDESLSSFVIRRFGREALERVAQPLVSGIYTADPTDLSLRATMPRFLEMEARYGSIIRAMRAERRAAPGTAAKAGRKDRRDAGPASHPDPTGGRGDSGARYSLFVSFAEGMSTLIDALAARLPDGSIRRATPVRGLQRIGDRWRVALADGAYESADGVILACPAYVSAELLAGLDAELAAELAGIRYASSATMSLAFRRDQVPHALDGFGFVVPAVEERALIAATFSSVKFAGRAPDGWVLVRAFLGGAMHAHVFELADADLREAVVRDLRALLGVQGPPRFAELHRWPRSMPQYPVGHLQRVKRIEGRLAGLPGLAVAGNAFGGVGIPDCVHSAETAAERVVAGLTAAGTHDRAAHPAERA
ncbi:MAG: protoporphyrinogen oxidase [Phycisphaerae bacterium]